MNYAIASARSARHALHAELSGKGGVCSRWLLGFPSSPEQAARQASARPAAKLHRSRHRGAGSSRVAQLVNRDRRLAPGSALPSSIQRLKPVKVAIRHPPDGLMQCASDGEGHATRGRDGGPDRLQGDGPDAPDLQPLMLAGLVTRVKVPAPRQRKRAARIAAAGGRRVHDVTIVRGGLGSTVGARPPARGAAQATAAKPRRQGERTRRR